MFITDQELSLMWTWIFFMVLYAVILIAWPLPALKDKPLGAYFLMLGLFGVITLMFYAKTNSFGIIASSFLLWFFVTGFKLGKRYLINRRARYGRRY